MKPGHWRGVLRKLRLPPLLAVCRLVFSVWDDRFSQCEAEVRLCAGLQTQTNCLLGSEVHQDPGQSWINLRLWESQLNGILRFLAKAA